MRVAVVAPHFAEYATRLALALSRRADVLLVAEARNRQAECEGLALEEAGGLRRAGYRGDYALRTSSPRAFLERRTIYRAIDAFAPDVIHLQEQGDVFMAALVERYGPSLPIVVTVHDPEPHTGRDSLAARQFAQGIAKIRGAADAYHVHGAYCAGRLGQAVGTSKPILATAHGTILEPSSAETSASEGRYLFFGRMEAYKGIDTLLDAIDLLSDDRDTRFVIAGRGPELERHRPRIDGHRSIELIDRFLAPRDAIGQFQQARAVLVPYRDATQSGVVSAAFGNGRPVIATRVGGLVDAVEDGTNGLLVPPGDPAALAQAIRSMGEASLHANLSQGAQSAAAGPFAWSTIVERLHGLYAEVVDRRPGTSKGADPSR